MEQVFYKGGSNTKLVIATPFYEMKGWSPYISSLFQTTVFLGRHTDIEFAFWELSGDAYIDRARNSILNRFLQSDFTHLMFIDSDEAWDIVGFARVLLADVDIVGAGYPCKNKWDFYGCLLDCHKDGTPIVDPDTGLISASMVPTGFMKISRKAVEALSKTVDTYTERNGAKMFDFFGRIPPMGEDGSFNVRCDRAGIKRWVEPRVSITHYGVKGYEGNYHEFLSRQPGGANCPISPIGPLVSVVITSYNYGQYLAEAIESVLNQTYRNVEIIIVDDASSDDTSKVATAYPTTLIRNDKNAGVAASRNSGILKAKGDWICCLDADDVLEPEYIEACIRLAVTSGAAIVGTGQQEFGLSNRTFVFHPRPSHRDFLEGNKINCSSLFHRKVWQDTGGYNPEFAVCGYEDWDLWVRATYLGHVVRTDPRPLFKYRKHGASLIDAALSRHEELKAAIVGPYLGKQE